MPYRILEKKMLSDSVARMRISAPAVARNARPGQFVVVIAKKNSERIPLTIVEADKDEGAVTIIFQTAGFSTKELAALNSGENLCAFLGPLGRPTEIKKAGAVLCIGGGVGIAEILPVAAAFKKAGNTVTGLIGARAKKLLILEDELREVCDELLVTTDDGSYGMKGNVADSLAVELKDRTYALVYAVGPVPMMKRIAELTRPYGIKTMVSLNPLMVDATGMCGACRCRVAGRTVFGCVDGPEFDAHQVDFEELEKRLKFFKEEEEKASVRQPEK